MENHTLIKIREIISFDNPPESIILIENYFSNCSMMIFSTFPGSAPISVSYTHLRAHETVINIVCRLLHEN